MSNERLIGVVLSADIEGRGFGFIQVPGASADYFYHVHDCTCRGVAVGQQVSFVPVVGAHGKWKATDVQLEKPAMQELPVADRSEKLGR
jgi:cold shock CspA family protein